MSLKIVLLWNLSALSKPMKMIFIAAILIILIPHIICLCSLLKVFILRSDKRHALAFIGGYGPFSLLRKLSKTSDVCPDCCSILTENNNMEIEDPDSTFTLIGLLDRGRIKMAIQYVPNAVFTLWKVFTLIEGSPVHLKSFLRSDSRSI